ncbi:UNVERIFIED_CONTAM: Mavicyanin [Sesamum angustifolium]|uniref:Mavicyanin n=1 Tax=Sesamum angustifolium TaxID=2727405 RepID=A0AAW2QU41_9LAMI
MGVGTVLFLFVVTVSGVCNGEVYKVGDSAAWTLIAHPDYNTWASSKTFRVGDTLIFQYDPRYHNVLEVSRSDFHTCNTAAPITTYATGNDSVVIRSIGHYYYVCGFVGHCEAGQKVDIRVAQSLQPATIPIPGPIQAPNEPIAPKASPIGPMAPSPSPSSGESLVLCNGLFSCIVGLVVALVWVFN